MTEGWYIEEDHVDSGDAVNGWNGEFTSLEDCKQNCRYKFRLLDDDGKVQYVGYSNDPSSFVPLDQFGCTSIEYYENGKWELL